MPSPAQRTRVRPREVQQTSNKGRVSRRFQLAKANDKAYTELVIDRNALELKLRQALHLRAPNCPALAQLDLITDVCLSEIRQHIESSPDADQAKATSPIWTVPLPAPEPDVKFAKHWLRIGEHLKPEIFLERFWKTYTSHSMLLLTQLQAHDRSLSRQLYAEAQKRELDSDAYFLSLGIMTRRIVLNPPPQVREQAARLLPYVAAAAPHSR